MSAASPEWLDTRVGDLGRVVTGKTPPTERSELFGSEYPFITPTDIDSGSHAVHTERFLSEIGCEFQRSLLLPPGTVCFVCIGATIGKICIAARPSFTNQQINSVVVDETRHDRRFVCYSLVRAAPRIRSLAGGAATPIVNKSIFSDVAISVPPLPIQRKIARILSAYDDLIANNSRRIRILEEMAQAIYREWFVHFRFPGHKKVKLVPSPLGPIPTTWFVSKLAAMANVNALSIQRGGEPEQIVYVDIASVSPGSIDEAKRMRLEDAPGRARRIVRDGDIIWSMVRPNRRSFALVLDPEPNLIVSTGFAVVSATGVPFSYLYHALTTDEFVGYLANRATGAAYPALKAEDFENAEVLRPDGTTLERFDGLVRPMIEIRNSLGKKNRNLRQTRDLLLPKLISGEVDVSDLDINVGDAT